MTIPTGAIAARACLPVHDAAEHQSAQRRKGRNAMNAYAAARSGEANLPARAGEAPLPSAYSGDDPFLAHGMGGGGIGHIVGKILKVPAGQNGEYSYKGAGDADDTVIPRGSEMMVAVDKLALRAVRWESGKVAEQLIGYVADGFRLPARDSLGYTDQEQWERDDTGRPRDPWRLENLLPMKRIETGDLFTAFISAKGSPDDAVRHLSMSYGRTNRTKYPVVRLGRDSFVSKRNGHKSWFPTLPLTGLWLPKTEFGRLETGEPSSHTDKAGHRGYADQKDYQAPADWDRNDDPGPMEIPDYAR